MDMGVYHQMMIVIHRRVLVIVIIEGVQVLLVVQVIQVQPDQLDHLEDKDYEDLLVWVIQVRRVLRDSLVRPERLGPMVNKEHKVLVDLLV